ncbi:MAG: response regulator transcription factor [Aureispira sp.]|nr:response regulator transcription factor [Aureispira sp.]
MHILIVDDEKRARETVHQMLKLYCPEVTQISEADSVKAAVEAIHQQSPSLILLDIRLGDGNGFDVLKRTIGKSLNVIFITAYDEYAIKALKVSAIDYLLKPIDLDEFLEAIQKAKQKITQDLWNERIGLFLQNVETPNTQIKKLTLKTADSIHIINIEDIAYCESDRNYTTFHLIDDRKILVSKSLREYENLLPKKNFMRTHQSYLVNFDHVIRYEKGDKNYLVTNNEKQVPVAIRKKDQVIHFLKDLH